MYYHVSLEVHCHVSLKEMHCHVSLEMHYHVSWRDVLLSIIVSLEDMYYHVSLERMHYHVSHEELYYHVSWGDALSCLLRCTIMCLLRRCTTKLHVLAILATLHTFHTDTVTNGTSTSKSDLPSWECAIAYLVCTLGRWVSVASHSERRSLFPAWLHWRSSGSSAPWAPAGTTETNEKTDVLLSRQEFFQQQFNTRMTASVLKCQFSAWKNL